MNHPAQASGHTFSLGVGGKLWLAVALLVLGLFGLILVTALQSRAITAQAHAELAIKAEQLQLAKLWYGLSETHTTRVQAMYVANNPALDALFAGPVAQAQGELARLQQRLEAKPLARESRQLLQRIVQQGAALQAVQARARQLREQGQAEAAQAEITRTFNPQAAAHMASLREFAELQRAQLQASQERFEGYRVANMLRGTVVMGVYALLILVGAALLIRSIRTPLNEVVAFAQKMADGHLGAPLRIERRDEFGQMGLALNAMRDQIARVVTDVRRGTDGITAVAHEVAHGSQNLSMRTEQSASNLEQTAASMEGMLEGISQAAASARTASAMATEAVAGAQKGREVVVGVVQTMNDIQQASQKISDIISVIDGIAFQTNILALNAAVEAARAGEQGRGFAVVASEVRSLAGRSAEAAKEIKALINNSVERVWAGAEQVQTAGESIQTIVDQVERVRAVIAEISSTAGEQSEGVAQINAAIGQLDQMTQQNAALVEESAAAAKAMSDQALQLSGVVRRFRLDAL